MKKKPGRERKSDEEAERDEEIPDKKREPKKARRRALRKVGLALLFHYIATWLLLVGMGLGLIGIALIFSGLVLSVFAGASASVDTTVDPGRAPDLAYRASKILVTFATLSLIAFFLSNGFILLGGITD